MMETSKKLLVFFCGLFLANFLCALVWAWAGRDTTIFAYTTPATGGAAASAAAFYYNKAKHENLSKGKLKLLEMQKQIDTLSDAEDREFEETVNEVME